MTNKPKHTPGPWVIYKGAGHARNSIVGSDDIQTNGWPDAPRDGISNRSFSKVVCEFPSDLNLEGPRANALLIASAPDLLAACEAALSLMEGKHTHVTPQFVNLKLHEAIAKATGKEQDENDQ